MSGLSEGILAGFSALMTPEHLLFCVIGTVVGLLVGVVPGVGSAAAIAILLPATFHLDILPAIIMLCGIWYGSMYGGGVSAILLGIPGQSTAVMTVTDGLPMSEQGRAGDALNTLVISSFLGGLVGFLGLLLFSPILAELALSLGPPEYFIITTCGILLVTYLVTSSVLKALVSAGIGLVLGVVGLDPVIATDRFTFGTLYLQDGISLITIIMGLFGVSEILRMIDNDGKPSVARSDDKRTIPQSRLALRVLAGRVGIPALQGSIVGFVVGLLPGAGAAIASYVSYATVKRLSPNRDKFGKGTAEGVAGPEGGNNAATGSGMIPLLTLGLPADIVPAMMLGAFALHGVTPGPRMIVDTPELFWGIAMSFFAGNLILVAIMLPFSGLVAKIALIPSHIVAAILVAFMLGGAYGIGLNATNILATLAFGYLGYFLRKLDYPIPPLILAFVLGPTIEMSFRQTMIISGGDIGFFLERPIAASIFAMLVVGILVWLVRKQIGLGRIKK